MENHLFIEEVNTFPFSQEIDMKLPERAVCEQAGRPSQLLLCPPAHVWAPRASCIYFDEYLDVISNPSSQYIMEGCCQYFCTLALNCNAIESRIGYFVGI